MWAKIVAWLKAHLSNSWMTNMDYGWFMAHSGWAALIIFASWTLFLQPRVTTYTSVGLVIFAALKEYWYDATYESPKQTFKDNTEDFAGYCVGITVAWVVIAIKLYALEG